MSDNVTHGAGRGSPVTDGHVHAKPAARPMLLFVFGMGRTGTSAMTRVLSLCGVTLPTGLMGADKHNPRGYWEPRDAIMIDETIMRRHNSNWYDPTLRLEEEGTFDAEERAAWIAKIRRYLATLPAAPIVILKDMRMTTLSDLWFEAARQSGYDVAVLIPVRHPDEVIPSCSKFIRISPELSSALWLKYSLLAERHSRGVPRVFIEYTNLLQDWRREIKRTALALQVDLNPEDEAMVEEFLTSDLRRNVDCGPVSDRFGTNWMSTVYQTLHAAARDEPWDASELDRVFEAYRASEQDFRMALEDFHDQTNSVIRWVIRPPIYKRIHQLIAMAHGRRGAWA